MKIIYAYKKEHYELEVDEGNADDYVIETLEKNSKKCSCDDFLYDSGTQAEFLNFWQFHTEKGTNFERERPNGSKTHVARTPQLCSDDEGQNKSLLKYVSYFEKAGYIVKEGDIYGAHFLLYLDGEQYTHAVYAVYAVRRDHVIRDLIRMLRVSRSVKKNVILILLTGREAADLSANIVYVKLYSYK
ncbi:tRNA intron endonuclease catalytic C-terminal domain containing protein [Plasmodium cynomolgi strain B]|uniref:tRNA-intron lyase n=1 Tax=Plasmodium cynomolgi (strain B) TaxID=1120755 RepID=K6UF12_PLACD|nr:tRNA intron endonuclease catalytic C-terminal domain containing protein [Plasmodium cynomolgi strain B]GAB69296.1 tRNA intron endonuclease catalytic C-terminal domain containing protein [Plasmodium cynomolgi strain B]